MRRLNGLLVFVLAACTMPQPNTYATPSGKPEVEIASVTKSAAKDALVARMITADYTVKDANDYMLAFEKQRRARQQSYSVRRYDYRTLYHVTCNVVWRARPVLMPFAS